MRKSLFMTMLLGLILLNTKSLVATNTGAITGVWKCIVTDVPAEYGKSTITFSEKEGKLTGVVKFDSGEEIRLSTVKYVNNQLVLTLYVEGYEISVEGKVTETKITGTADTPEGKVTFTANKVPEKKK